MTLTVSASDKSGLKAKQDQITAVGLRPDAQSKQHKIQLETELVSNLLAAQKLSAASIISTLPVTNQSNALYAAITKEAALITSYGATVPGHAATQEKDRLERQLVLEEMADGKRTGASILSGMTVNV